MTRAAANTDETGRRLYGLMAGLLQLPEAAISSSLTMRSVESWDSLRHMELIAAIEKSYAVDLTFDEIVAMQSVSEIEAVLHARGIEP